MRSLIIDNYDSFTYNLYQFMGEAFGEAPDVVTNDVKSLGDIERYAAIVVSPGPGNPYERADFGICSEIIRTSPVPLLGVCLGHQGIVAEHGGIVTRHEPRHGRASTIFHSGRDLFKGLPSPFTAVRYHSLVVKEPLPLELELTAETEDGVIMGIAHRERPMWGVQFHPESIYTEYGRELIRNFGDLARARRPAEVARKHFDFGSVESKRDVITSNRKAPAKWLVRHKKFASKASPEAVFTAFFEPSANAFWLDSSSSGQTDSRFSFMGDDSGGNSFSVSYSLSSGRVVANKPAIDTLPVDPFTAVEELVVGGVQGDSALPFDFAGGFVGFFGYELKHLTELVVNRHQSKLPDLAGVFVDRFLAFDHQRNEVYLVALHRSGESAEEADGWIESMARNIAELPLSTSGVCSAEPRRMKAVPMKGPVRFELEHDRDEYLRKIALCKAELNAGETYEVCLTNRIRTRQRVVPIELYKTLRRVNPAPRSSFLKFDGYSVLSSSPEKFVSVDKHRTVQAKPIKGTRPRHANAAKDKLVVEDLASNEKDISENLMITDLLRNDLNRVCDVGSVHTPKLMEVETYADVHQLVSTIQGTLKQEATVSSLLRAAFPPGSMTGAPKRRTLEIIDELEKSARGVYSGSIGYLSFNGSSDLNVVIRTIVQSDDELEIGVGGAIICLSNPQDEFDETLVKGRALMRAISAYLTGSPENFVVKVDGRDSALADLIGREAPEGAVELKAEA